MCPLFEWPGHWVSPGSSSLPNLGIVHQLNGDFRCTFGTSSENLVMQSIWFIFMSIHFTISKLDKERVLSDDQISHEHLKHRCDPI